ncbi:MAG: Transposase [Nitrospira sp.]|nr:Transposase [Nitrospira sp.]
MARRELRDDQWKRIQALLPGKAGDPGRTARDTPQICGRGALDRPDRCALA